MKRWKKRHPKNSAGFTLAEVLVSFMIVLMVSQIMFLGISFAAKMGTKSKTIEEARRGIGTCLAEKSDAISGTVRLELWEDHVIEVPGWLCTGEHAGVPDVFHAVWVEEQEWNE